MKKNENSGSPARTSRGHSSRRIRPLRRPLLRWSARCPRTHEHGASRTVARNYLIISLLSFFFLNFHSVYGRLATQHDLLCARGQKSTVGDLFYGHVAEHMESTGLAWRMWTRYAQRGGENVVEESSSAAPRSPAQRAPRTVSRCQSYFGTLQRLHFIWLFWCFFAILKQWWYFD
jgi:hypothetical protein